MISENDTFESVILESVKIESVRVDRHPLSILKLALTYFFILVPIIIKLNSYLFWV